MCADHDTENVHTFISYSRSAGEQCVCSIHVVCRNVHVHRFSNIVLFLII